MTWYPIYKPICLPTNAIPVGNGFLQTVPAIEDLDLAHRRESERLVECYELVCLRLAEARLHLARLLALCEGVGVPADAGEAFIAGMSVGEAIVFLGGPDAARRIKTANTIEAAKLP